MNNFNHQQITSMICYYLEKYPSVAVALECTYESVVGDGEMAKQVLKSLERVKNGESDVKVLLEWADQTGSRDLQTLAERIQEAYEKKEDIGYYVRRLMPGAGLSENKGQDYNNRSKHNNRNNKNYNNNRNYNKNRNYKNRDKE